MTDLITQLANLVVEECETSDLKALEDLLYGLHAEVTTELYKRSH